MNHYITGHNLLQPSAPDAPLEFDLTPGDAELVAKCATAIDALRAKNAAASLSAELKTLEEAGFQFVEDVA